MKLEKIENILKVLNDLLKEPSAHSISYQWDQVAQTIRQLNIVFEVCETHSYYLDSNLTAILGKKSSSNFEQASKWRNQEKEIIDANSNSETVKKRTEPSLFEYSKDNNTITAYLNTTENQRLIFLLIEQYNLLKK